MAASENSFLGIAEQSDFGTENTDDAEFKYMLFTRARGGPNAINTSLPPEVGGGAMLRDVLKVGVNSGVQGEFVPRPETLGFILKGMTGNVASSANNNLTGTMATTALTGSPQTITVGLKAPSPQAKLVAVGTGGASGSIVVTGETVVGGPGDTDTMVLTGVGAPEVVLSTDTFITVTQVDLPAGSGSVSIGFPDGSYTHTFTLGADQFSAPYYTARLSPGLLWGETFKDCRFAFAAMTFQSPDFIRGAFGLLGRTPTRVDATEVTTNWEPLPKVDGGPQFITPVSAMELPTGVNASVLNGSFTMQSNIPLDQQYVVGDYEPEALDIVNRGFTLSLGIKITDPDLYTRMLYDPNEGSAWVSEVYREADFLFKFVSDRDAAAVVPTGVTAVQRAYTMQVTGNAQSGGSANLVWTAQPVDMIAQRQLVLQATGTYLADPLGGEPITITLVNRRPDYATPP